MDFKSATIDKLCVKLTLDGLHKFADRIEAGTKREVKSEWEGGSSSEAEVTITNQVLADFVRQAIIDAGIEDLPPPPTTWCVYDSTTLKPPTIQPTNGTLPRLIGIIPPREATDSSSLFDNGSAYIHGVERNLHLVTDGEVTAPLFRAVMEETRRVHRLTLDSAEDNLSKRMNE